MNKAFFRSFYGKNPVFRPTIPNVPCPSYKCRFCGKSSFLTARALTQHVMKNLQCKRQFEASLGMSGPDARITNFMATAVVLSPKAHELGPMSHGLGPTGNGFQQQRRVAHRADRDNEGNNMSDDSMELPPPVNDSDSESEGPVPINNVNKQVNSQLL